MAHGDNEKSDTTMVGGMALLNLLLILTQVGMVSYVVNSILDGKIHANAVPNAATQFLIIFTAAAVLIHATSVILGFIHSARRNHAIRACACSLSLAAVTLYALAVGFGSKQTQLGGVGSVNKAIFAFDVILLVTGLIYSVLLYMGIPYEGLAGIHTGNAAPAAYRGDTVVKV